MSKKLTVIKKSSIYESPIKKSRILVGAEEDDIFEYTRIKRRNKITWYELKLRNNTKGYLEVKDGFQWELVKINTEGAYFIRNDNERKEYLKKDSFVKITKPYPYEYVDYDIETLGGVSGKMSYAIDFDGNSWAWFKRIYFTTFVILMLGSIAVMIESGRVVFGGLVILMFAVLALVITLILIVFMKVFKSILFDIRIRF